MGEIKHREAILPNWRLVILYYATTAMCGYSSSIKDVGILEGLRAMRKLAERQSATLILGEIKHFHIIEIKSSI